MRLAINIWNEVRLSQPKKLQRNFKQGSCFNECYKKVHTHFHKAQIF